MTKTLVISYPMQTQNVPIQLNAKRRNKSYIAIIKGLDDKFIFKRKFMTNKLSQSKKTFFVKESLQVGEVLEFKNEIRHEFYRKEYYAVYSFTNNNVFIDGKEIESNLLLMETDIKSLKTFIGLSINKRIRIVKYLLYGEMLRQLANHVPGYYDSQKIIRYEPYYSIDLGCYDFYEDEMNKIAGKNMKQMEIGVKDGLKIIQQKGLKMNARMKEDLRSVKMFRKSFLAINT